MNLFIYSISFVFSPNLSWRDVQYLIAYTSDPTPFQWSSVWSSNGAGLMVSHEFGFGAIDAEAMVTRAQHWSNVPQQMTCTFKPSSENNASVTCAVVVVRSSCWLCLVFLSVFITSGS